MQEASTSPLPPKEADIEEYLNHEMSFEEAMTKVSEGKKIHKLEWEDPGFYACLEEAQLVLHKPDGKIYQWIISEGDLLGKDYIII